MNHEQALALAKEWNADGKRGTDIPYEIELHDVAALEQAVAGGFYDLVGSDVGKMLADGFDFASIGSDISFLRDGVGKKGLVKG